jgi:hypothetical protein
LAPMGAQMGALLAMHPCICGRAESSKGVAYRDH